MRHELFGDLPGQRRIEPAALVDSRKLLMLAGIVRVEFLPFAIDVGLLGISLRVDRHIFAGRHRHRACHQARNAGDQDILLADIRGGDPEDQACRRHDAVIGAED